MRQFDEEMFEGAGRARKTQRQRREARRERHGVQESTPAGQQCPEVLGSQKQGLLGWYPGAIGTEELKRLQVEDPSLAQIREYARRSEQTESEARFLWRDGILYRQWKPRKPKLSETIEQIVLPTQCRQMVMKLAHDQPTGGHLGRKKTQDRIRTNATGPTSNH